MTFKQSYEQILLQVANRLKYTPEQTQKYLEEELEKLQTTPENNKVGKRICTH